MARLESLYDIEFKGETGKCYGMVFTDSPKITSQTYDYNSSKVNGRIGNIISPLGGKDNATIECEFWIIADCVHESIRRIKQWLTGSGKLRFSDSSDASYEVLAIESIYFVKKTLKCGKCTVKFLVYPYEFLDNGQYEMNDIKYNPYSECMPSYRITGNGVCTLTVNGKKFEANVPGEIIIDSRKMQSYKIDYTNANTLVKGNYEDLMLPNGEVNISISEGFELMITPKWGYLV